METFKRPLGLIAFERFSLSTCVQDKDDLFVVLHDFESPLII